MSASRTILRAVLLSAAAGLLALAANTLRERRLAVETTTQQIEDTISALDPATRAAVIARLTADAGEKMKGRVDP